MSKINIVKVDEEKREITALYPEVWIPGYRSSYGLIFDKPYEEVYGFDELPEDVLNTIRGKHWYFDIFTDPETGGHIWKKRILNEQGR